MHTHAPRTPTNPHLLAVINRIARVVLIALITSVIGVPARSFAAPPEGHDAVQPMPEAAAAAAPAALGDTPLDGPLPMVAPLLSPYEKDVLARGRISAGRYVAGGLLGTWLGFGAGHAVQGRYEDGGIIFSVGEAAGLGVMLVGLIKGIGVAQCPTQAHTNAGLGSSQSTCIDERRNEQLWSGMMVGGALLYSALRVWEIVDLWSSPPRYNREYRRIQRKASGGWQVSLAPVVLPSGGGMAVATGRF